MKNRTPNLFYKIIHADPPFLVPRSLADIGKENFGTPSPCKRPLVLFADPQEAFEKALWFYAHNILPLAGEPNNLPVTVFMAKSYGIDAMVSELPIAAEFIGRLALEYDSSLVASVTLIGRRFEFAEIEPFMAGGRRARAVLALPDIGAFAESCREELARGILIFHPDSQSTVMVENDELVVSKNGGGARRILRCPTAIAARGSGEKCRCKKEASFRLR